MQVDIWNIFVASMVLMLVNAAMNPAVALMNTAIEDSEGGVTSTLGYFSQSLLSVVSIFGALMAPALRKVMGHRATFVMAGLLHIGLYVGMVLMDQFAIIFGSAISGIGMGIIWVALPSFVVISSKHKHIERNLSYHILIYNLNGVVGNLMNYLCLDETQGITNTSRVRFYTVCTALTVASVVIGGLAVCKQGETDSFKQDIARERQTSDDGFEIAQLLNSENTDDEVFVYAVKRSKFGRISARFLSLISNPGVRSLLVCNTFQGASFALITILPMCVSSTYSNRRLIPILGGVVGLCKLFGTGVLDVMSQILGYEVLLWLQTLLGVGWMLATLLVFPANSLHRMTPGDTALVPTDEWVIYLIGLLGGISTTWMYVLTNVATGKISSDTAAMHGFHPDVLFTVCMVTWSLSNAVTMAVSPFVNLYFLLAITLFELLCCLVHFKRNLLSCLRQECWLNRNYENSKT